jgi:hypothetical protein
MTGQSRDELGKFGSKGDMPRQVRSLRLTEATWQLLGKVAESQGLTRADLLELMAEDGCLLGYLESRSGDASGEIWQRLERVGDEVVKDPTVTRNGKDSGAVKRTIAAVLQRLIATL